VTACDKAAPEAAAQQADGSATGAVAQEPASVEVAKEGTKFDPPVTTAQMPEGARFCEMDGKVHYARMAEGDGKCAVCGMELHHAGMMEDDHMMDGHMKGGHMKDGHMKDGQTGDGHMTGDGHADDGHVHE
jgi:hypothetical protein